MPKLFSIYLLMAWKWSIGVRELGQSLSQFDLWLQARVCKGHRVQLQVQRKPDIVINVNTAICP